MKKILVIDDEKSICEVLEILFIRNDASVKTCGTVEDALSLIQSFKPDLILTDLRLPKGTGMDVLRFLKDKGYEIPVIMMTAFATTENAVEAMKLGAFDYVIKPFDVDEVLVLASRALEHTELKSQNRLLKKDLERRTAHKRLIGTSAAMREVVGLIDKVANTKTTVLLSGESGTGKEIVARAIHARGRYSDRPFVAINCGAIPESLIESELFGHLKGSFTGANINRVGLFESAADGILFLDEIGELSPAVQVKLLRVLQEQRIRRIGDTKDIEINCRIIAATNRVLEEEVRAGNFREDLFFRINVIEVIIPPLRERKEDIPFLAEAFAAKCCEEQARHTMEISSEALNRLLKWNWPGNVRELENVIERAVTLSPLDESAEIGVDALPANMRGAAAEQTVEVPHHLTVTEEGLNLEDSVDALEKSLIEQALKHTNGHKTKAAQLLGLSFRSFRYRSAKHGL